MKFSSIIYRLAVWAWSVIPFKLVFVHLFRNGKIPLRKYHRDLWFEGVFKVKINNKRFKLFGSKGDLSTTDVFWNGLENGWDSKSIFIWAELSKCSEVIFDIGANIGVYGLVAKTVNPSSKVYAFEPSQISFQKLKKNIEINNFDIKASPYALANKTGSFDFFDLKKPTAISSLKLNENLQGSQNLIKYNVQVTTIKQFVFEEKIPKIDLLSIDVEKNEPEVLEGMGGLINKFKPNFIIEVLNEEIGGKVELFFREMNYFFYFIDEDKGLKKVNSLNKNFLNLKACRGNNFLICQEDSVKIISHLIIDNFETLKS